MNENQVKKIRIYPMTPESYERCKYAWLVEIYGSVCPLCRGKDQ